MKDERGDFFIHVKNWVGQPLNAEPDKCDQLFWTKLDALPENTLPYIRKAIENFRVGIPFEEFGWKSII